MSTLTRRKIKSTDKSPEIARLIQFLNDKGLNAADLGESIETAERTITNYIWNDTPIGGQLLRQLLVVHGVSIDWILSGEGAMYADDNVIREDAADYQADQPIKPLIPYLQHSDITVLQDFWWLVARATEESLMTNGAKPNQDYTMLDLYKLAQPFVLHQFKETDMDIQAHENN